MVNHRLYLTKKKKKPPANVEHMQCIRRAMALVSSSIAAVVSFAATSASEKVPIYTSILTGQCWIEELLQGRSLNHL